MERICVVFGKVRGIESSFGLSTRICIELIPFCAQNSASGAVGGEGVSERIVRRRSRVRKRNERGFGYAPRCRFSSTCPKRKGGYKGGRRDISLEICKTATGSLGRKCKGKVLG